MYLGGNKMKNFDSRTYSINDFIEWDDRGQLEISPKFQRRSVWSPQAKSYLIDTILKDKPLPKILGLHFFLGDGFFARGIDRNLIRVKK